MTGDMLSLTGMPDWCRVSWHKCQYNHRHKSEAQVRLSVVTVSLKVKTLQKPSA